MTREEAKEIFLNRGFINGLFDGDKWRQSIVVISKWLEQEPCEDVISRKDIQSFIAKFPHSLYNDVREVTEEIDEYIKELPSVQPIRPKGEWIERELIDDTMYENRKILMCSNCKLGIVNGILGFANFCPNCGADMRGKE